MLLCLILVGLSAPVFAQNTVILSATSKPVWTPSPDNDVTFGTPAQPILTNYQARLWARASVQNNTEPTSTTPLLVLDFGKPVIDAQNNQTGPIIKPLVVAGTEYIMFLHAVGPGGASPTGSVSAPFGFPSIPRPATSTVSFTP